MRSFLGMLLFSLAGAAISENPIHFSRPLPTPVLKNRLSVSLPSRRTTSLSVACKALQLAVWGAPGSGRERQCAKMVEEFGVIQLSTGDILRDEVKKGTSLGLKAKQFMDKGVLVPDNLLIGLVRNRLSDDDCINSGFLLNGFPRDRKQAESLTNAGVKLDCFLLLDVPESISIERFTGRRTDPETGETYHMKYNPPPFAPEVRARLVQKNDDTEEFVRTKYREFVSNIAAVRNYYKLDGSLAVIDAARGKSEVTADVLGRVRLAQQELKKQHPLWVLGNRLLNLEAAGGIIALVAMDKLGAQAFKKLHIGFPSSLGVMVTLFALMVTLEKGTPKTAKLLNDFFAPGLALLKVWMPLFFVPPLVVLPAKFGLIANQLLPLASLVVIGFFVTTISAALVGQMIPSIPATPEEADREVLGAVADLAPVPALPKPIIPLGMSAIAMLLAKVSSQGAFFAIFSLSASVGSFLQASRMPAAFRTVVHPVLGTAVGTSTLVGIYAWLVSPLTHIGQLGIYYGTGTGVGELIASALGTVITSFGLQLYVFRKILLRNAMRAAGTTLFSASIGLGISALLARILEVIPTEAALATLTRSITTPLALAGQGMLGGDTSLAALLVVATGLLGASFGENLLKDIGVEDQVSSGLAMGGASHSLGAAAVASKPLKFAAAVVSMTLTGLWSVVILSVPQVRALLLQLCSVT